MAALSTLSTVASIGSTVLGLVGGIQEGEAAEEQAEAQARIDEQRAQADRAEAGRAAREETRQSLLVQSQQIARAAAQGGASDPSVVKLISDVEAEGQLRAGRIQAGVEQTAQDLEYQAQVGRAKGKSAKRGGYTRAIGTTLSGVSKIASRYA